MPGWLGSAPLFPERARRGKSDTPLRLLDPVAAWYVGNMLIGAPPPQNGVADASPSRPAPPTAIVMPGRSASMAADHRGLGWPAGWRAGSRPIGRAAAAPILFDAFARSGHVPGAAAAPKGVIFAPTSKLPPPLLRLPARGNDWREPRAADYVSADGVGSSSEKRRQAGAGRGEDRRRRAAAHRPGQWRAGGEAQSAGVPCSSSPTARASCASR